MSSQGLLHPNRQARKELSTCLFQTSPYEYKAAFGDQDINNIDTLLVL